MSLSEIIDETELTAEETREVVEHLGKVDILVYSKSDCPYCARTEALLSALSEDYLLAKYDDRDARERIYDRLGLEGDKRTMPQIMVAGKRVGGYHDLVSLLVAGPLRG